MVRNHIGYCLGANVHLPKALPPKVERNRMVQTMPGCHRPYS
jgi:hypothetical protein